MFKKLATAVAAVTLIAGLSACATSPETTTEAATANFPITISHAFGTTTIESEPTRVVTWGWGAADAAIALGVIPVGVPAQPYGGDAEGVLPWIRTALEAQGATIPTMLTESDGVPPYEAIAALAPDLILSPYSGLDQAQYDTLSKIAPVVAYPDLPWATPWRDVIRISGEALGRSGKASALLQQIDATVAAAAEAHPEFAGKTIAQVWDVGGTVYVYRDADARVQFAESLGFTSAPSVEALAGGESEFYYTLSTERLDELSSDVLLVYGTTQTELDAFLAAPYAKLLPQIRDQRYATLTGATIIASVSPPTALSLTWGLDQFVSALARAVR